MRLIQLKNLEKFTGGDNTCLKELLHPEHHREFGGRYSLAHATVAPGEKTLPHKLSVNESYYILEGQGEMHVEQDVELVHPGDTIEIPIDAVQWIVNLDTNTPLTFLCICDPAWTPDCEKLV